MAVAETRQMITDKQVKDLISTITATPGMCGFEVYIITKATPHRNE